MNIKDELLKGLTEEQIEKARKCKSEKELLELAKSEKIDLTDEQLASINGGGICGEVEDEELICPRCGSRRVNTYPRSGLTEGFRCIDCGTKWD